MNQKTAALIFFSFLAICFLGIAVWDFKRATTFLESGRQTSGTVLRYEEDIFGRERTERSSHRFHRIISFALPDGTRIEARDPSLVVDHAGEISKEVPLYYLHSDPKIIRVGSRFDLYTMSIVLGIAGLLSILGGVIFFRD